jgi:hypothetical protein
MRIMMPKSGSRGDMAGMRGGRAGKRGEERRELKGAMKRVARGGNLEMKMLGRREDGGKNRRRM